METATLDELDLVLLVDIKRLLLLEIRAVNSYISSLLPAPQYSYGFPGQIKLQSLSGAKVDEAARALPQ